MDKETGVTDPNRSPRTVYLHSASYDLFILVLTIFSLLVAVGLFLLPLGPATDAILLFVDFILCALFLCDFLLSLRRAPSKAELAEIKELLKQQGEMEAEAR